MRFFTIVNIFIWAALGWMGHGLVAGVAARDAGGFPNHSQKLFYVVIPIGMVVLALVGYALSRRTRLIPYVAVVLEILVLIAAIPFALVYGGGV